LTKPRLATDMQVLQVAGYADRGIGRYVAAHAAALSRAGRLAAGLLAAELPPPSGLPTEIAAAGLVRWNTSPEVRALLQKENQLVLHVAAPFLHADPADPDELVVSSHWARTGVPRVTTIYDLIPLRFPGQYLPTVGHSERYRARADWVAESDLLLAISDHTRREALELLNIEAERVVTIGTGVSPYFSPPDGSDTELFRFHFPQLGGRPFVLTVSGSDVRKNTERLTTALGHLVNRGWDLHLVVVGDLNSYWRGRLGDAAAAAGLGDRLVLAGRVGEELLRACYRHAAAVVVPSLAEGFGLPVLEAAACGCPALVSSETGLAEAAATPLATFDPTSTEAIADALARLLHDEHLRGEIMAAQGQFVAESTWPAVADRTVAALDTLSARIDKRRWRPPPQAPRLALVGPLPPLGGGMAKYDVRVLRALAQRAEVDAVTPMLSRPALPEQVGHVPVDAFGSSVRPAGYDGVIYALGNSDGHLATALAAVRHPGWLWLHEVRLPALATTALAELDDQAFQVAMGWLLERSYPGRAPQHAARLARRSVLELIHAGVGLTPLLVARSRGVLVNSEAARQLLLVDLPPMVHRPPVQVLPPACPPPVPSPRTSTGDGEPLVVVLGVVSMAKRPDIIIDAIAVVSRVHPCRLAFVGPCPPILAQVIVDRSRLRGIQDLVDVAGEVDDANWRAWCDRAALVVQLREWQSGETSAAILEALSRGLPIVTNLATAAGYPIGTVAMIDSCTPVAVAERLVSLLDNREAQERLVEGGLSFAAGHQFSRLADAMLSAVVG
jgi:glycosyltransferase involved in cell wall biosynthesis